MNDTKMINHKADEMLKMKLDDLIAFGLMKFDCF